jgi:hypothetical protein
MTQRERAHVVVTGSAGFIGSARQNCGAASGRALRFSSMAGALV